jgi:hypothetical protein
MPRFDEIGARLWGANEPERWGDWNALPAFKPLFNHCF